MLDYDGQTISASGRGLSRRTLLRVGALAATGLTLTDWMRLKARGEVNEKQAKAKSVIQLWMSGGPSHLDTFDPKPGAGPDYTGPLRKPLETNVPGMQISELFPKLATTADKFSIVRSMTHAENGHETATYIMQTCTMPGDLVYPSVGAVVAYKREQAGYAGSLPPYMSIPSALGRFSEAGFLGTSYKTFGTGGDANADRVAVQGIVSPSGVTDQRVRDRQTLLESVDSFARGMEDAKQFETMDRYRQRAFGLMLGDAKKAFDMSAESKETRERYGRNRNAQAFLLARRLVEQGVPFITINWGGWDTHRDNFGRMKELLPPLDQAFSALLEDLAQRGLLESTIVTWSGEFGRTPKVAAGPPWDGGRHHYGNAMSVVVAGGGFQGGKVYGSTDTRGEFPRDRTCYPWDLSASMYTLLGIDPRGKLPHPNGCVAYVTPTASGELESGGLLKDIM